MIGARLAGGLGNQLFQYAAARALAQKLSTELIVDLSHYENNSARRYLLDRFHVRARPANPGELAGMHAYREKSFVFDASFFGASDGTLLEGFWQSEKYFSAIRPLLLEELKIKAPGRDAAAAGEILGRPSVSVHVRRGDYAADPKTHQYHGLCGLDYYKEAITRILKSVPDARFFLFSDDPGWTGENLLPLVPRGTLVRPHPNEEEDLRLMSLCGYHIIANSSFSWWSAWLSQSTDKIVYAPKKWFSGADLDTSDLIPASWTRL